MTLRQEAYAMIDALPDDDSIRFFIDIIRRFNAVTRKTNQIAEVKSPLSEKRQAFLRMEEMKKKCSFPRDYDYEQVRRESMEKNMVALIDANVILNYITDREDQFRDSSRIVMDLCSQGKAEGYIAFHSLSIIWYSLRIPNEEKSNTKDFKTAKTKIYTPDEFVMLL